MFYKILNQIQKKDNKNEVVDFNNFYKKIF